MLRMCHNLHICQWLVILWKIKKLPLNDPKVVNTLTDWFPRRMDEISPYTSPHKSVLCYTCVGIVKTHLMLSALEALCQNK